MAGVEADAQPRAAAGALQQLGELLEGAPERAAGTGGVLEMQLAALALRERLTDRLPRARDRGSDVSLQRRAGVQHDAACADRLPDTQ